MDLLNSGLMWSIETLPYGGTMFWTLVYVLIHVTCTLLFRLGVPTFKGWESAVANRCCSTFHATLAVYFSWDCMLSEGLYLPADEINSAYQDWIIEFSLGYFIYDFVYILLAEPDILFIFHHSFSLITWWSSRYILHSGGMSVLIALGYAETTAPLFTLWWVSKRAHWDRIFAIVSPLFTVSFTIVRCIVLPYKSREMLPVFLYGARYMPYTWSFIWFMIFGLAILGGMVWTKQLVRGLIKYYKKHPTKMD